ncbi:MAG: inosine/xanthosine triphosphatase [Candidatus Promineifilaceae bacterium]|nr:inosine/xanthosine triphosphatase [Candidatus Promineifilaceae bacterium]
MGSNNPVKIEAVRSVIERAWPGAFIVSTDVDSGVRAMPMSDGECQTGARNRAVAARQRTTADLGVGIEGGVQDENGRLMLTAWTVIVNGHGLEGIGGSGRIPIPVQMAERIRHGEELGHIMDELLHEKDVKKKGGAIGTLTGGLVLRQEALALGVAYALAPFITPHLYE